MVSKLRLMNFLEIGINGGERVRLRIQQFRRVNSSRMGFKLIIYFVPNFGKWGWHVYLLFSGIFLCLFGFFFHPPHVPLEVMLLQQCVGWSPG